MRGKIRQTVKRNLAHIDRLGHPQGWVKSKAEPRRVTSSRRSRKPKEQVMPPYRIGEEFRIGLPL
jgi:hypothetical protein